MRRSKINVFAIVLITILAIAAIFVVTSLVMASFHNVGLIEEWKSWFDSIESSKDTVSTAAKTAAKIFIR